MYRKFQERCVGLKGKKKLRPFERHPTYCALKEFPEGQRMLMYDLLIVFSKWTEKYELLNKIPPVPPPLHFAHLPSSLKTFADCIEGHGLSLCKNPKYYHNIHVSSFLPSFAAMNGMLFVG